MPLDMRLPRTMLTQIVVIGAVALLIAVVALRALILPAEISTLTWYALTAQVTLIGVLSALMTRDVRRHLAS